MERIGGPLKRFVNESKLLTTRIRARFDAGERCLPALNASSPPLLPNRTSEFCRKIWECRVRAGDQAVPTPGEIQERQTFGRPERSDRSQDSPRVTNPVIRLMRVGMGACNDDNREPRMLTGSGTVASIGHIECWPSWLGETACTKSRKSFLPSSTVIRAQLSSCCHWYTTRCGA